MSKICKGQVSLRVSVSLITLQGYCGGTFMGLVSKLDYIEALGANAVRGEGKIGILWRMSYSIYHTVHISSNKSFMTILLVICHIFSKIFRIFQKSSQIEENSQIYGRCDICVGGGHFFSMQTEVSEHPRSRTLIVGNLEEAVKRLILEINMIRLSKCKICQWHNSDTLDLDFTGVW